MRPCWLLRATPMIANAQIGSDSRPHREPACRLSGWPTGTQRLSGPTPSGCTELLAELLNAS
eukprot:1001266-Alexandrium_andersonii.AAC.1